MDVNKFSLFSSKISFFLVTVNISKLIFKILKKDNLCSKCYNVDYTIAKSVICVIFTVIDIQLRKMLKLEETRHLNY